MITWPTVMSMVRVFRLYRFEKWRGLRELLFFAWKTGRECILTVDKLMRRGHITVNGCYLCKEAAESCNHLLLWCPLTNIVWYMVYGSLGINWVIGGFVKNELWAWNGIWKKSKIVNLIPLTIFWVIWEKRNYRAFDGRTGDLGRIKDRWIHTFGILILGHDLYGWDNFWKVFDVLTNYLV